MLFWGTSFVVMKTALDTFTPMTVIWLRMAIASIAFAPFWRRVPRPAYLRGDWKVLLLAALCIPCLYYLLEGFAVQFTTSSQAGVVSAVVPLLVAGGAWLFLHERLTWRGATAIGLSLVGVAVLSVGGAVQESASNPALGNFLELLAMVAAAGSMLAIKHLSMRYDPWLLTGMQAGIGMLFFAPMAFASSPGGLAFRAACCLGVRGLPRHRGEPRRLWAVQLGAQTDACQSGIARHQCHSGRRAPRGLGGAR